MKLPPPGDLQSLHDAAGGGEDSSDSNLKLVRGRNRDSGTARTSMLVMVDADDGRCW